MAEVQQFGATNNNEKGIQDMRSSYIDHSMEKQQKK